MKKRLEALGKRLEAFSNHLDDLAATNGTPYITGSFILDSILKELCKSAFGIFMFLFIFSLASWVISFFIFFGWIHTPWFIITTLILSIPTYVTLCYLFIVWREHLIEEYHKYKQRASEYKQNYNKNE